MPRDLDTILTAFETETDTLRANGAGMSPDRLEEYRSEIALATTDYRTWLDEETVIARSGKGRTHWRNQFPALLELRMAKWEGQGRRAKRFYRACIVPVKTSIPAIEADAREAARRFG